MADQRLRRLRLLVASLASSVYALAAGVACLAGALIDSISHLHRKPARTPATSPQPVCTHEWGVVGEHTGDRLAGHDGDHRCDWCSATTPQDEPQEADE